MTDFSSHRENAFLDAVKAKLLIQLKMPTLKGICQTFSKETSFHGFRRLWIGSSRLRWPFWVVIILFCITLSIYQIGNKLSVLVKNPLNININLDYQERMEFPTVTVCNKLRVRVSFIVNNSMFLNMFHIIFPQIKKYNFSNDDESIKQLDKTWTAKRFFEAAGIQKKDLILWCRMPNGDSCSSADFVPIITNEGVCYKLNKTQEIIDAGHGNGLKILLNLAEYERLPDTDSTSGIRLVIHNSNQEPMPSRGYDVMPGYQVAIVLRKHRHTQLYNCQRNNPLKYYRDYSYSACKVENILVEAMKKCKCKPYTLPALINEKNGKKKAALRSIPDCSILQHFDCVATAIKEQSISNASHVIRGDRTPCFVECVREEFEEELYYNVFREDFAYKKMLKDNENDTIEAYQLGRDAVAFLNFYKQLDRDYLNLVPSSYGFQKFIVDKKLMPPFGTVWDALTTKLPCLTDIVKRFGNKNMTERLNLLKLLNTTLVGALVKGLTNLEPALDALDISETLNFATSLRSVHSGFVCKNSDPDICSLSALYDLLTVRAQVAEKRQQTVGLLNGDVKNLSRFVESFTREDDILLRTYKPNYEVEKGELNKILNYYLEQIKTCLTDVLRTFDGLLANGQPSISRFDAFLEDLRRINGTLSAVCQNAGSSAKTLFNADNRKGLAEKIVQLLTDSEVSTLKSVKFNNALIGMAELVGEKLPMLDVDPNKLNESLSRIEAMDRLLNAYVNQTTRDVFKKSDLFYELYASNPDFQNGVKDYNGIVTNHFKSLEIFLQTHLDTLKEAYPGSESDLNDLLAVDGSQILEDLNANATSADKAASDIDKLMCLKKARLFLVNLHLTQVATNELEMYRKNVESLVSILKLYVHDIENLKGFYRENLGYVKIYFRDMGVRESVQEHSYDFLSFLCDVGGIIGLWLGGSVLSLFETVDLLVVENVKNKFLFYQKLRRLQTMNDKRLNNKTATPPNNGQHSSDGVSTSVYVSCRESFIEP